VELSINRFLVFHIWSVTAEPQNFYVLSFAKNPSFKMSFWLCVTVVQGRTIYFTSCEPQSRSSHSSSSTDSKPAVWFWLPVCCQRCTGTSRLRKMKNSLVIDSNCFIVTRYSRREVYSIDRLHQLL